MIPFDLIAFPCKIRIYQLGGGLSTVGGFKLPREVARAGKVQKKHGWRFKCHKVELATP